MNKYKITYDAFYYNAKTKKIVKKPEEIQLYAENKRMAEVLFKAHSHDLTNVSDIKSIINLEKEKLDLEIQQTKVNSTKGLVNHIAKAFEKDTETKLEMIRYGDSDTTMTFSVTSEPFKTEELNRKKKAAEKLDAEWKESIEKELKTLRKLVEDLTLSKLRK